MALVSMVLFSLISIGCDAEEPNASKYLAERGADQAPAVNEAASGDGSADENNNDDDAQGSDEDEDEEEEDEAEEEGPSPEEEQAMLVARTQLGDTVLVWVYDGNNNPIDARTGLLFLQQRKIRSCKYAVS